MNESSSPVVFEKLDRLRSELVEMAFLLDRRGRPEAADVAMQISGRVGEIQEELAAEQTAKV